ncbi:hypothetical protein R1sor_006092 [Riccia sorocarpa]|uniref:Uncharacterized protein n=1 Tax=Riccia sorocarpa TaxID=122646 RepID=A0ABD3HQN0_9MARC
MSYSSCLVSSNAKEENVCSINSSARRIMLSTPLKSPVRIRLRSSPGCVVTSVQAIDSQPASQVLANFRNSTGLDCVSQGTGWSLRREKGNARKKNPQFKRPGPVLTPAPQATDLDHSGEEGSGSEDDALPAAVAKPGRIPPPSIRVQRRWKSGVSAGCSASRRLSLDQSKLPVLEHPVGGGSAARPYVLRSLFRESGCLSAGQPANGVKTSLSYLKIVGLEKDVLTDDDLLGRIDCDEEFLCVLLLREYVDDVSGLARVSVRLPHNGKVIDTFSRCCEFSAKFSGCPNHSGLEPDFASVSEQVVSTKADVLLQGTILSTTFESGSESDWVSEQSDSQVPSAPANDSEEDSDWEDFKDEILEEDLPRLGLMKTDPDFFADPLEWQLADENWPSASTQFSHNTAFEGVDEEPVPSWFYSTSDPSKLLPEKNSQTVREVGCGDLLNPTQDTDSESGQDHSQGRGASTAAQPTVKQPHQLSHSGFLLEIADELDMTFVQHDTLITVGRT